MGNVKKKVNGRRHVRVTDTAGLVRALYSKPLPSPRSGPLYNAFSYPTKISPEAAALFIATHTKPGDVVLDAFAGSGTTGLAVLLCDKPTDGLKQMANALGVTPRWGRRHAVLYELSVLGSFVAKTMCNPPNPARFRTAAEKLLQVTENSLRDLYRAKDPYGNMGDIRHVIWTDVLVCNHCRKESNFFDVAIKHAPLRFADEYGCAHCKKRNLVGDSARATETVYDPVLKTRTTQKKRRLAMVFGQTGSKKWKRAPLASDLALLREVDQLPISKHIPVEEMQWGDLHRAGYHEGITHVHQFYTRRNLVALGKLWETIGTFESDIQNALRLLVLSYNTSHSTLMTRVVLKQNQKDFILTGAQSGVLYISSLPVEKNVFRGLQRKINVLVDAFGLVYGSRSQVEIINGTSSNLRLRDASVDYVFTDPPFGGYIPYAEINHLNEAWLGRLTNRAQEIIVSPSQGKRVGDYGKMIGAVFHEIARVLKNNGKATVAFHSSQASIWQALMQAYTEAGLEVRGSSVLDKLQSSFKQVVSEFAVKADPLLLLTKSKLNDKRRHVSKKKTEQIINEVVAKGVRQDKRSKERTVERLYSRYVSRCLEVGVPVSMNAHSFYTEIRERQGVQ